MNGPTFTRRQVVGALTGLGLAGLPGFAGAARPGLSLDTPLRDGTIVDGRTGLGLSGGARPGATVEIRLSDADGPVSDWTAIATADAAGRWSGPLPSLPRKAGWVTPELRLRPGPEERPEAQIEGLTAARLAAGHVVAIWGQSELHRAVLPAHAALDRAPPVRDPEALRVSFSRSAGDDYGDPAQFVQAQVSDATPVTAHMAALSNLLAEAAPGERFHLVFHTRAGTGLQQLLADTQPGRRWADDVALQAFALPEGGRPGLAWMSWYNSDAALAQNYGRVLFAALTGHGADGTPLRRGEVPPGGRLPMDHAFPDLYGPGTDWAIAGPHRFEMDNFDAPVAACRAAVNRMFDNPLLPGNIHRALEPLTYLNGNPRWKGDFSHPDTLEAPGDGMTRLMLLMGTSILRQLGFMRWPLPEFDAARLTEEGRVVEVWSSTGPVTTTRRVQGGALPPGAAAVAGFTVDGVPARHVALSEGRVQIRRDAQGSPFARGTRIAFGAGGIGSEELERDTRDRQVWRDYPIVDMGQAVLEGIPVKAQTPRAVLDVIPAADRAADPAPAGSLLPREIGRFAEAPRPPGWVKVGPGWRLDARTGTATAEAETGEAIRAATPRRVPGLQPGSRAVLGFVPETEGLGPELLQIIVSATGGGATDLFHGEVVLTPGRRMAIPLEPMPRDRDGLAITFRRRGHPTGRLVLGGLGLYPAGG